MKKTTVIFAILTLLLMLSACGAADGESALAPVRVMIAEGEGYTIEGENPVFIPAGGTAVFRIAVDKDWSCMGAGDADYDSREDTLTLKNVRYPVTVVPDVIPNSEKVRFFIEPLQNRGSLSVDTKQGFIRAGTTVHLSAVPHDGWYFTGWVKGTAAKGSGEVISHEAEFIYTVTEDTFLYGGFAKVPSKDGAQNAWNPAMGTQLIAYNANGGVYAETGKAVVTFDQKKYHIYENTLPAKGYFVRGGYQLLEYNTKPDGTGDAFGPGSKLTVEGAVTLYCIWAKEAEASLFKTTSVSGGVAITGYSGSGETLVIPEQIGGKDVVRIKTNALNIPDVKTLVLPRTIQYIESNAIHSSSALTTLYMHDAIESVNAKAITDMSGLANFRLSAAHPPAFTDKPEGNFSRKWERLVSLKRQGKKVLVVVAGSSTFYGLDSPSLEQLLGGEYSVVNFGTSASTSILFFLEVVSQYVEEGDIVVYAPEMNNNCVGATALPWVQLRATEYFYNAWRDIDMRRYSDFFSALTSFNKYRKTTELDYSYVSDMMNDYGDRVNVTKMNSDNYDAGYDICFDVEFFSGDRLENLLEVIALYKEAGVSLYVSWAPCNANAINENYRSAEAQDYFIAEVERRLGIPVISHPSDYIYAAKYMYNSDHHVNIHGRVFRTENLAKDVLAQLAKEGK